MAQNPLEGTVASGLGKMAENIYDKVSKIGSLINKTPTPGYTTPKPDTSWHDEMVQQATASFSKPKPTTTHTSGQQRLSKKYGKGQK